MGSREEQGMLGEERTMLCGERMLRVLLGQRSQLCFTAGPEIIPGGLSVMGSPWEPRGCDAGSSLSSRWTEMQWGADCIP